MRKIIFLILLVQAVFLNLSAQQSGFVLTGKVLNVSGNTPLQGASVFAQNTTFGTATDASGNFKLWLPAGGYDIIVTFTGYTTESKRITTSDKDSELMFELKPREKEMEGVSVVSSNEVKDGWTKYGNFFLEQFIGKNISSGQCNILNKDVLKFFYSRKRNRLKVTASEPLLIENKHLGYNITYALDSFTHDYRTEVSLYTGYPLFEEMVTLSDVQRSQWDTARHNAYKGSILHFMRSLYQKQLKEQGFEIQFVVNHNDKDKAITVKDFYGAMNYQMDDSTQTVLIKPNQNNVGVIYTQERPAAGFINENTDEPKDFQFSVVSFLPGDSLVIEQNGYYFEQDNLTIHAYWTWDKVGNLLPYNYVGN